MNMDYGMEYLQGMLFQEEILVVCGDLFYVFRYIRSNLYLLMNSFYVMLFVVF